MKRVKEIWGLIKFASSAIIKIVTDSILKKEPQTYKEEREQQKKELKRKRWE